jgi:hypothetical protein
VSIGDKYAAGSTTDLYFLLVNPRLVLLATVTRPSTESALCRNRHEVLQSVDEEAMFPSLVALLSPARGAVPV